MTRNLLVLGFAFSVLAAAGLTHAMPLDLRQSPPDIRVGAMTISYTDATDTFSATGTPITYDPTGIPPQNAITGGSYTLTAIIDSLGQIISGSLTITGATTDIFGNPVSGILLTASGPGLAFGFTPDKNDPTQWWLPDPPEGVPAKFEFTMSVTGGALVQDYGGPGAPMGIIAAAPNGGFDGDFVGDFSLGVSVNSNNFGFTPEPTSLTIIALGVLALTARKIRSRTGRRAGRA